MGNNKFKLSNMIPNTWFYKLKYLTKPPKSPPLTTTTSTTAKFKKTRLAPPPRPSSPPPTTTMTTSPPPPPPPHSEPRKSYHFTRDLPLRPPEDPPLSPTRKSKSKSKPKKHSRKITAEAGAGAGDRFNSPETGSGFPPYVENFDISIHVDKSESEFKSNSYPVKGVDFQLPRIVTKPNRSEEKPAGPVQSRRLSVSSPNVGVRLRINSPRIMGIKQGQNGNFICRKSVKKRRSMLESLAVVKSSDDPQRDFRESMVEMIVQNDLRASKELEDLLACYLSLNSDEYHDVIIKVFKQIWFDLSGLRYKKLVS